MVLKNSKWDKKAKYKYMKKHDILPKKQTDDEENVPRAKWTSKKKKTPENNGDKIILEDSEDEWDSDVDDALINHFYPQLVENDELTLEQKIKIKKQILTSLQEQEQEQDEEDGDAETRNNEQDEELDGIYLGSEENKQKEMPNEHQPPAKFDLQEFINNLDVKPKKNRKLLRNKISDNFLEEYGISSYKDLNRDNDDYNDVYMKKQQEKIKSNIHYITNESLDGFIIGQSTLEAATTRQKLNHATGSNIRYLTEEEKKEDEERKKLVEQEKFYKEIKKKFDDENNNNNPNGKKGKVIDINNFNNNDASQLAYLNEKILRNDGSKQTNLDDDIDTLLGISSNGSKDKSTHTVVNDNDDFDNFMNKLSISEEKTSIPKKQTQSNSKPAINNNKDLDFLDDLLG